MYVAGNTSSTEWASEGFDTSHNGGEDAFVAKLNPSGEHIWSTYLGGDDRDVAEAIAVDASDNVYVTGETCSIGWTSGGFDTSFNGGYCDAFVAKLNSGGAFIWSTYVGGSGYDYGYDIAVDASSNVYVTGWTSSADLASGGFDTIYNGGIYDAFIAKLNSDGAHLCSTYLGAGTDSQWGDYGWGIAVDSSGTVYVTGHPYRVPVK